MQTLLDYLLPSLESLGVWGYWVIALMVLLQGFAPTTAFSPGSLIAVLGGGLAAHGFYDFWDMVWFVAVADAVGGEATFYIGARGRGWLKKRRWAVSSDRLEKAQRSFEAFGPAALLIGRLIPMGAFVPLLAGIARMKRWRFALWNAAGALAYGLVTVTLGHLVGTALPAVSAAAGLAGAVVLTLAISVGLVWLVLLRLRRAIPFFLSIFRSIVVAVGENPDARALAARHPRLFRFLWARLRTDHFFGLPTTIAALAFGYFGVLYISSTLELFLEASLVALDERLANLLFAFRDPQLVRFFTIVTAIGAWRAELAIALTAAAMMWLSGRRWLIAPFWIGLIGNAATVFALKALIGRPRPQLAVYVEHSASFPSGHAATSLVLFGALGWILAREKVLSPLVALLTASTLVFFIGVSRLYLVEHYLADVLNGYLVGALWLLGIIWFMEWRRPEHMELAKPLLTGARLHTAYFGLIVVGAVGLFGAVQLYGKDLNLPPEPEPVTLDVSVATAFREGRIAAYTESVLGSRQEPVNFVVLADDEASVRRLFRAAGWQEADQPSIATMARAAVAAWLNQPYPTAPITPGFWSGRPHDLGFQKGAGDGSLRQRHHARLWDSGFRRDDGKTVFVGTASYDDALKWGMTHHIDPNIDAERDFLGETLEATGRASVIATFQITTPILGQNMTGDPFFTDGMALVIADIGEN